jgi:hypothetical protein
MTAAVFRTAINETHCALHGVLFYTDINIGEETGVKEDTSTVRPLQCAAPGCSNVGASCPNKVFFNFPASEDRLVRF